ncbi:MAG: tape measure protein, partial [Gammaproteobacteria bacterium]|nr:tape measure protein [Gammaproteobacteria bacterium]
MADVTAARLVIPVTTSANQASADLNKLNNTLLKLDKSTDKLTESLEQNRKKTKEQSKSMSGLKKAFAAIGVALLVRQFVKLTDTYTGINDKLKLVTNGTKELKQRQQELFDIAQKSRSSFQSTAELYARLSRSTKELNVSNKDLLTVTDSINKAFLVSGASSEEASNAIRQLSQGLAAGALRGDEFNSVAEQAPRLQEAIAASLGVTVGELRALAAEGKITSKVIIDAMTGQAKTINDEFAQLTPTFGQVGQTLENTLLQIVGAVGQDVLPEVGRLGNAFILLSKDGGILIDALSGIIKSVAFVANGLVKLATVVEGYVNDTKLETSLDVQTASLKRVQKNLNLARNEFNLLGKSRPAVVSALEEIARTQGKVNGAFADPASRERAKELLSEIDRFSKQSRKSGAEFDQRATRQAELTELFTELTKDLNVETGKNVKSQAAAFAETEKRAGATKNLAGAEKNYAEALKLSAQAGDPSSFIAGQRKAFEEQKKIVAQAGLDVATLEKFQQQQRISQFDSFFKQITNNQNMSFSERQTALQTALAGVLEQENLSNEERLAAQKVFTDQSVALEQQRFQALADNVALGAEVLGGFNQIAQNISQV